MARMAKLTIFAAAPSYHTTSKGKCNLPMFESNCCRRAGKPPQQVDDMAQLASAFAAATAAD